MRTALAFAATLTGLAAIAGAALSDDAPRLAMPLVCEPHMSCFIQNYVDLDAGPGVSDFACGSATYDAHSGVDFRLHSAADAGSVAVVAAADGTVTGVRDGVPDAIFDRAKALALKGRECGNGVVIDHGGGWETQYCHLKQGSVTAQKDQRVKRGDALGSVGYSGFAAFAHLHFAVRQDGRTVDPFAPAGLAKPCDRNARTATLFEPSVAAAFTYRAGEIMSVGFAGSPPVHAALELDHTAVEGLRRNSGALLVYGRLLNLAAKDRIRLVVTGPGGTLVETTTEPLPRTQGTYTSFAGKKRTAPLWPPGTYEGRVEIIREGAVIATKIVTQDLR